MESERHKPKKREKSKEKRSGEQKPKEQRSKEESKIGKAGGSKSRSKSQMLAEAQKWKPITSPELREAYSTKTDWAKKLIPKLKAKAEAPEEKEES
ncbi:MAG TPA: hypothetical protein VK487_00410 [Candidatus Bathyarchaeia archaeon]|nr:hypothetical protein [Candidatus Bathyarchaeia archaeon]